MVETEREFQRDPKPVAVEQSEVSSVPVPGREVARGQLGRGAETGLLSPVDLEPRLKANLQLKIVLVNQETQPRAAGTEGMSSSLWQRTGGTPKMC